jgi:hypothetical protein
MGMKNRRIWWGISAGTVAIAAVLGALAVQHMDAVARQNETTAQLISDQYESFYAIYASQLIDSEPRTTNAQLEPLAIARQRQIQFGTPNYTFLGYSGSAKLLDRNEALDSTTWVSIEVDVTYPEAFGGHGTLATCYAVSMASGPKAAAPVTSFEPACPQPGGGDPYPSATS